ncbi:hypothetical protein NDN16_00820 [Aureimonas altamirensis]|uniref:hypothetical protein n=1 Tax=Aureimonas altamirensis TaxID=370622 RepID=UPI0020375B68|nr:hypothetical protein [Aureimonas altamirensis]MCM2502208.1 hypothetical protein [Aureimonas altamirensis]
MKSLIALAGGLTLVALSSGAAGTGASDVTRVVTIGDRTGPAFYSAIEGRYRFVEKDGGMVADLPR